MAEREDHRTGARMSFGQSTAPTTKPEVVPQHGRGHLLPPWPPGRSGNPGGLGGPGSPYHEARRICAEASPEAAAKQVALMSSEDERVALMATESVLNRGVGKPREADPNEDRPRVDLSALSPEQRRTLAELLQLVLGAKSSKLGGN